MQTQFAIAVPLSGNRDFVRCDCDTDVGCQSGSLVRDAWRHCFGTKCEPMKKGCRSSPQTTVQSADQVQDFGTNFVGIVATQPQVIAPLVSVGVNATVLALA